VRILLTIWTIILIKVGFLLIPHRHCPAENDRFGTVFQELTPLKLVFAAKDRGLNSLTWETISSSMFL